MNIDEKIKERFRQLSSQSYTILGKKDGEDTIDIQLLSGWGVSALQLIGSVFGENSFRYDYFQETFYKAVEYDLYSVEICIGILESAYDDYKNGYLFNVRTKVKAEVGDDMLEQARSLLRGDLKDMACVVGGIALELALKDLCEQNSIEYTEKAKAERLNIELRKADVYNESMRKQVTAWLSLRNHAAHGEWQEYNRARVDALINGVERFIGEFL